MIATPNSERKKIKAQQWQATHQYNNNNEQHDQERGEGIIQPRKRSREEREKLQQSEKKCRDSNERGKLIDRALQHCVRTTVWHRCTNITPQTRIEDDMSEGRRKRTNKTKIRTRLEFECLWCFPCEVLVITTKVPITCCFEVDWT